MSDVTPVACPDEVLASIVWYPDQLDDARRGLVEAHVAECAACREELDFVRGAAEPEIDLPEADRVYARLLERIERHEGAGPTTPEMPAPRRMRRGLGVSPAALAAGIALVVAVGAIGLLGGVWLERAGGAIYSTVAEPPGGAADAEGAPLLDVVFRDQASADRIHAALRAIGSQVIAGPTQLGVYRVRLPPAADAAAAARILRGEGDGVAIFAEPATR